MNLFDLRCEDTFSYNCIIIIQNQHEHDLNKDSKGIVKDVIIIVQAILMSTFTINWNTQRATRKMLLYFSFVSEFKCICTLYMPHVYVNAQISFIFVYTLVSIAREHLNDLANWWFLYVQVHRCVQVFALFFEFIVAFFTFSLKRK